VQADGEIAHGPIPWRQESSCQQFFLIFCERSGYAKDNPFFLQNHDEEQGYVHPKIATETFSNGDHWKMLIAKN
jgi:hypothetical protein